MREIVLDTETTGISHREGHRIVEIGCVELLDRFRCDREFHTYLNPCRDIPAEAVAIHGLDQDFLADKPHFGDIAGALTDFVGDSPLVIHNASFDMGHLNAELGRAGLAPIPLERATDTLKLARIRFPGKSATLDALCRYFGIDNTRRELHGALLDARLLAEVYIRLVGASQRGLGLEARRSLPSGKRPVLPRQRRPHRPSDGELGRHGAFIAAHVMEPLWGLFPGVTTAAAGAGAPSTSMPESSHGD